MKKFVVNYLMNLIKKNHTEYDEIQLEEIEYGLVSIYLSLSKMVIIIPIAIILGIIKEFLIFMVLYNIIRMPSFGLHATKSWICLVTSTIAFIGMPILCNTITISFPIKIALGIIGICLMYKNSPADTHKKPIVNQQRRDIYKFISVMIAITYTVLTLILNNQYISNCLIVALILQCFIVSPLIYRLFHLPYDNYKEYLKNNPELSSY